MLVNSVMLGSRVVRKCRNKTRALNLISQRATHNNPQTIQGRGTHSHTPSLPFWLIIAHVATVFGDMYFSTRVIRTRTEKHFITKKIESR